jgi:hypothetical protein
MPDVVGFSGPASAASNCSSGTFASCSHSWACHSETPAAANNSFLTALALRPQADLAGAPLGLEVLGLPGAVLQGHRLVADVLHLIDKATRRFCGSEGARYQVPQRVRDQGPDR